MCAGRSVRMTLPCLTGSQLPGKEVNMQKGHLAGTARPHPLAASLEMSSEQRSRNLFICLLCI